MYCQKCGNQLKEGAQFCDKCGTPVSGAAPETQVLPASVWQRVGNYFIDTIFLYILVVFVGVTVGLLFGFLFNSPSSSLSSWIAFFCTLIFCGYHIFCESIWQRTLGKVITQTKVVDRQGNKPSFLRIVGRSLARLIPFEWISFLLNGHPIGWHDAISGTRVVSSHLTPEEAGKIDPEKIHKAGSNNGLAIALIVIVIIIVFVAVMGIFSAIVLAALNTARSKGADAAVQSDVTTILTESAIYYDSNNNSYGAPGNSCTSPGTLFTDPTIATALSGIENAGSMYIPICNNTSSAWAVYVPLQNNSGDNTGFCVDSTGNEKADTALPAGATICN